jgi:hypothetical protein
MILNEHQYITTTVKVHEFEKAIANLESKEDSPDPNQNLRKQVHLDALNSQLEELQEEIAEYEALKNFNGFAGIDVVKNSLHKSDFHLNP